MTNDDDDDDDDDDDGDDAGDIMDPMTSMLSPEEAAAQAKQGEDLEVLVQEALRALLFTAQDQNLLDPPYGRNNPEDLLQRLQAEVDSAKVRRS